MSFKYSLFPFLLVAVFTADAQSFKVLHYTETSGYGHGTRSASYSMLRSLGLKNGFTVDKDGTGAAFNSLSNLQQYAVVVFSNTSGHQILNAAQRANFEAYVKGGGSFIGIHAASDTYRHSTANGDDTGHWDAYAELLGASVQRGPYHTAADFNGIIDHVRTHRSTANLPDPWHKVEEYYYWENGYYNPANVEVLRVRSTGNNSHDTARPVSWYKEMPTGARIFYTALGHASSDYTSDTAFQNHIRDAVLWAALGNISLKEAEETQTFHLFPNPTQEALNLAAPTRSETFRYQILDLSGKNLKQGHLKLEQGKARLEVRDLPSGYYLLQLGSERSRSSQKLPFIIL